jgi:hypothetical protein
MKNFAYWSIQAIAALALVAAWWQGWLTEYVLLDRTGISQAIALLGLVGSAYMLRAWRAGWARDYEQHLSVVRTLASYAVNAGLLGTLVGFMVALSGVVTVSGASELKSMVGALVEGMQIAIGTSIVGCNVALFQSVHRLVFALAVGDDADGE